MQIENKNANKRKIITNTQTKKQNADKKEKRK